MWLYPHGDSHFGMPLRITLLRDKDLNEKPFITGKEDFIMLYSCRSVACGKGFIGLQSRDLVWIVLSIGKMSSVEL